MALPEIAVALDPITVPALIGLLTSVVHFAAKYLEKRKRHAPIDKLRKEIAAQREQFRLEREREGERVDRLEREVAALRERRDRDDDGE